MGERRHDPVLQCDEEDAARGPQAHGAADDVPVALRSGVFAWQRDADHDRQAGIAAQLAAGRGRESDDRVLAYRLGQLDLGIRNLAADSQIIRRHSHELSNRETDNDDSDEASSTDRDVSSSELDDAQHDNEPDSSRNTSKRQKTDIDTSSGSNGNASTHTHSRNYRNHGDPESREGSDEGSDDNGYVRRGATATTAQDRLEAQMPCSVTGCKGRDATLSHML